jgi:hypothetical protein
MLTTLPDLRSSCATLAQPAQALSARCVDKMLLFMHMVVWSMHVELT